MYAMPSWLVLDDWVYLCHYYHHFANVTFKNCYVVPTLIRCEADWPWIGVISLFIYFCCCVFQVLCESVLMRPCVLAPLFIFETLIVKYFSKINLCFSKFKLNELMRPCALVVLMRPCVLAPLFCVLAPLFIFETLIVKYFSIIINKLVQIFFYWCVNGALASLRRSFIFETLINLSNDDGYLLMRPGALASLRRSFIFETLINLSIILI